MSRQGTVIAAWALGLGTALCATALIAADPAPVSLDGAVGSIRLPAGIDAQPAAPETTASGQRSTHALSLSRNGKTVQTVLLQSCVTAPPDLRTEKNLEILMSGFAVMQRQALGKVNGWVLLGQRRGYRLDSVQGGGIATTMWMVPLGEKMAMLRFERPTDFALDDEMIETIERIEFRCGTTP